MEIERTGFIPTVLWASYWSWKQCLRRIRGPGRVINLNGTETHETGIAISDSGERGPEKG